MKQQLDKLRTLAIQLFEAGQKEKRKHPKEIWGEDANRKYRDMPTESSKVWDAIALEAIAKRNIPWKCFHCGEEFYCKSAAAEHFGPSQNSEPLCQVTRSELESLNAQLSAYRDDDGPIHRQMVNMRANHADALRRAEEDGYAKGLRDGRLLPKA